MRRLLALALTLLPLTARAQIVSPLRIYNQANVNPDPLSYKLRMTGPGVACAPVGSFEVCTFAGVPMAAGLKGAYDSAAAAADNIIGLSAADGPVIIRDNAAPIGDLFDITDSTGAVPYLTVTPAETISLAVSGVNGAAIDTAALAGISFVHNNFQVTANDSGAAGSLTALYSGGASASTAVGTALTPWGQAHLMSLDIGETTGGGAKSIVFHSTSTGTLSWTPTGIRTITLPDSSGTVALTSDLSAYLPLAGGTMLGAITFTGTQLGTYSLGGTPTLAANLSIAANIGMTSGVGTGAYDFSAATGVFKTSTGANTIGGAVTLAANVGITSTAGTGAYDFSAASGVFKTSTGANTLSGAVTLSANVGITGSAGTGALSLGSMTGDITLPTGAISYTGASTKSINFTTTGAGSSITLSAGAASTWGTSSGQLTLTSGVANAGTNIGFLFNSSNSLTGTTILAKFQSNGSDRLSITGPGGNIQFGVDGGGLFSQNGTSMLTVTNGVGIGLVNPQPVLDTTYTLGASAKRFILGYMGAAVASQPACSANTRGGTMTIFATAGNSDTFQVCMKAAADTYAWRVVFTAP